jgi:hypothetical protein
MVSDDGMMGCGGSWIWAFLIFALLGGNGLGINRGGEQLATSADVQRGFDTNEITRKLDGISNGLCDGFYAQNTNMLNGFSNIKENIWNEGRAIQTQLAECCCTTQRAIDGVNYNNAMNTASINANTTAQTQKILDAISQNKIEALQGKINQLELQNALCGVVRYPNAWTYNAGTSPFCNTQCC